jgi:hypothetical protein
MAAGRKNGWLKGGKVKGGRWRWMTDEDSRRQRVGVSFRPSYSVQIYGMKKLS